MAEVPKVLEDVDAVMSVLSQGPWLGTGGGVHELACALMSVSVSRCPVVAGVVRLRDRDRGGRAFAMGEQG